MLSANLVKYFNNAKIYLKNNIKQHLRCSKILNYTFTKTRYLRIFKINLENTFARREKYSSELDISRSLIAIFEINLENTFARCEKYSSELDISRSLIRIFANMKRTFTHLSIILLSVIATTTVMCGCGNTNSKAEDNSKEPIFVTIGPLRQIVSGIVGDDFDIEVLVPAGASPESFEPTPRQFISLNKAKAVFAVGLIDFERNLTSKIKEQSKVADLSHGIDLIAGSCSHNHHGHHCHHGIDPHIWTSPTALKIMAQNAYNTIAAIYPDSTKYKSNYDLLAARLDSLDCSVRAMCERARVRRFIIYHPALTYLARDYGLEQIPIEHEGKEPSAKRLAGIIDNARADSTTRLFYQSTYPRSTVEVVAEDIGAEPIEIDPLREDIFDNIREITRLITE